MSASAKTCEATLQRLFGFAQLRAGQREVVEAVLGGRDVLVCWGTGAGKSLCFQLPALHSRRVMVVVSPLIALMQDQVNKLSLLEEEYGGPVATFLGSAQTHFAAEQRALEGEFPLVFVSPEKLAAGFLDALVANTGSLNQRNRSLLGFAIDEAHCVSEWGNDFRADYRQLGAIKEKFPDLPVIALTATATPRVLDDIAQVLNLRNPLKSTKLLDRANLAISVRPKRSLADDLAEVLATPDLPTIIYAPRIKDVEEVYEFLSSKGLPVGRYHGKQGLGDRSETHDRFMSDDIAIVVATVAFGMGIDKANIRRVVNYGPPKTLEEWVQQIGRAGRDGKRSSCILIWDDAAMNRYRAPFYTQHLTPEARQTQLASGRRLKTLANSARCRRVLVLEGLSQVAPFSGCDNCDNCLARAATGQTSRGAGSEQAGAGALKCDITPLARIVLSRLEGGSGVSKTALFKAIKSSDMQAIPNRHWRTKEAVEACLQVLAENGLATVQDISKNLNGCLRSWEAFSLSNRGRQACRNTCIEVQPNRFFRTTLELHNKELERQRQKKQRLLDELRNSGVDLASIPADELEAGTGPTILAQLQWKREVDRLTAQNNVQQLEQLRALHNKILEWRRAMAVARRVSPESLLPDHHVKVLALTRPTTAEQIHAQGVRVFKKEELVELIRSSSPAPRSSPHQPEPQAAKRPREAPSDGPGDLPHLATFTRTDLDAAVRKPLHANAMHSWTKFQIERLDVEQIAKSPPEGKKAVLPTTIASHLFLALEAGYTVDLHRIDAVNSLTQEDVDQFKFSLAKLHLDPSAHKDEVPKKQVLSEIAPLLLGIDRAELTEEQRQQINSWYAKLDAFLTLSRVGVPVRFGASRPRLR
ncbi:RecQ-like type 3) (RecQ3) (Exonuclease WRN) (RecQ protein-like 2) [Durusdinium trenchii]|uniref:DNA 3'-5' helicase n=1 Tax=Durusdinium trenchii TaxID=1381693 RepID=A0ABP0RBG5_9DINO